MEVSKKIVFIKDWILNYINSMPKKATSLVIGISGGIDSSVTSTLCAMTGSKTIVLTMPIKQISSQHNLSLKHGKWLEEKFKNVKSHTIELDEVFKSFQMKLSDFESEHVKDIGFMTCMTLVLMGNYAQTGHFGGPLAYTPFCVASHLVGPENGGLRFDYRRPKHPYSDKFMLAGGHNAPSTYACLLYTSPSPRDATLSRMPASA